MKSMSVFSLKVFGSDQVKSFSAGSLLMYETVDELLGISGLLRFSGLKEKGVDLADITKTLVCGVLDGKRSVRAIDLDVKGSLFISMLASLVLGVFHFTKKKAVGQNVNTQFS